MADSSDKALQAQAARHALLSEVVLLIARTPELDQLLSGSISKLKWVFDFERCTLAILDESGSTYHLRTLFEPRRDVPPIDDKAVPLMDGIAGQVMNTRHLQFFTDLNVEPDQLDAFKPLVDAVMEDGEITSIMALPLVTFDNVLGCITFATSSSKQFDGEDLKVAQSFATHLALAIDRWQQSQRLITTQAQLSVALDNMAGGMQFCDRDRSFILFNRQYSELYELPEDLVKVGGSLFDVLQYQAERGDFGPGDTDELIKRAVATYPDDETVIFERAIGDSGRTVQVNLKPTPDGGMVSIVTDITERKRAEERVQAANRHLRKFSEAVSEYLDPMLVDSLRDGRDVEPQVHFVTVFFADLVGSTRLSRTMSEEFFGTLVQEFVGEMQRIIKLYRGYLEDISGDGIFGYIGNFNSLGSEKDAADAVLMALEMQEQLAELSTEYQSLYKLSEPLAMRIGMSSGNALVGKTAGVRAIYTANGDIVNLGAKLEQKLKDVTGAGGILISEQTAELVKGRFALTQQNIVIEGQESVAYMVDQEHCT